MECPLQSEGEEPLGHVKGIWPYYKSLRPPMYTGVDPLLWYNTRTKIGVMRQMNVQKEIDAVGTPYRALLRDNALNREYVSSRPYPHWNLDLDSCSLDKFKDFKANLHS
jgi:hypothetical protein